jgi:hypothetical protein
MRQSPGKRLGTTIIKMVATTTMSYPVPVLFVVDRHKFMLCCIVLCIVALCCALFLLADVCYVW